MVGVRFLRDSGMAMLRDSIAPFESLGHKHLKPSELFLSDYEMMFPIQKMAPFQSLGQRPWMASELFLKSMDRCHGLER